VTAFRAEAGASHVPQPLALPISADSDPIIANRYVTFALVNDNGDLRKSYETRCTVPTVRRSATS
jgi:hypothetical protein